MARPTTNPTLHALIHAIASRDAQACDLTDADEGLRLRRMAREAADRAGYEGLVDAGAYLAGWTDDLGTEGPR